MADGDVIADHSRRAELAYSTNHGVVLDVCVAADGDRLLVTWTGGSPCLPKPLPVRKTAIAPLIEALYQMDDAEPRLTSPSTKADGATKASFGTEGKEYLTGAMVTCRLTAQQRGAQ